MCRRCVATLSLVGLLTLIPVVTLAQMGPRQGMGNRMGPPSGDSVSKEETTEAPREAPPSEPPTARTAVKGGQTSGPVKQPGAFDWNEPWWKLMQGMAGGSMEHPAASVPFYRERTFLLLVGVASAAGAFGVYRVTRSHVRRRRGPASFVTEAVLVVDLVDSTYLATHYGDGLAMTARTILKERTLAAAEGRRLTHAEHTGDGYFMTFSSVPDAAQTAIALLRGLKQRPPDLSPGPPLEVRAGISYGEILLDAGGSRHGAVINRAFRVEGLTRERFASINGGLEPEKIPDRNRIFLDEEAAHELRTAGIPLRVVGYSALKGFSGLHQVYEVLWEAQG